MNKNIVEYNDPDALPGVISKLANVSPLEVTAGDLKKINSLTLAPVQAEDVFIFKATLADNEQDDRNYMPFDLQALKDLRRLYIGKTVIKDHARKAENQIARVYDTELIEDFGKKTALGEPFTRLVAKIYMIKTDGNKDLISEILGGIKKEVSTSTVPEKMICSICGCDNMKDYCSHWPGHEYSGQVCKMILHGAKEAYELSFVAVPAQPRAGTHKSIGFTKPCEEKETREDMVKARFSKQSQWLENKTKAQLEKAEKWSKEHEND